MKRVVAVSDTHGEHRKLSLPDGEIFIHAGDITNTGELHILNDFDEWLNELDFKYKIIIAGNHDLTLEKVRHNPFRNATHYLINDLIVVDGISIYGSPFVKRIGRWGFGLNKKEALHLWSRIPENKLDILVTHGPPKGILDASIIDNEPLGCKHLRNRLNQINVRNHIFGHIHEGHGFTEAITNRMYHPTRFFNVSIKRFPDDGFLNRPTTILLEK